MAALANHVALRRSLHSWLPLLVVPVLLYTWYSLATEIILPAQQPTAATNRLWPNSAYWVAARLVLEGHADWLYNDQEFGSESLRLGANHDIYQANLPPTVLVFLPIGLLPLDVAYPAWTVLSVLFLLAAWVALLYALRVPWPASLALTALLPLYEPWREHLHFGQSYSFFLLLIVAGSLAASWADRLVDAGRASNGPHAIRAPVIAGLVLGVGCIAKLYYGVAPLVPALFRSQGSRQRQGRWLILGVALGLFGLSVLLTIGLWSVSLWGTAINYSITWQDRPETALTAYQSLHDLLMHLFNYDASLNPDPLAREPGLIAPLWWILAPALVIVTVAALWRRSPDTPISMAQSLMRTALCITLAFLLAPISVDYDYTLALFPLLVVGVALWEARASLPLWLLFGAALYLLSAPLPFNSRYAPGWEALAHYPLLYGTLLLWGLSVKLVWTRPPLPHAIITYN